MYLNIKETDEIKNNKDYKIVKLLFNRNEASLTAINHKDFYMIYFREFYYKDYSLESLKKIIDEGLDENVENIDKYIVDNNISFFNEFLYKVFKENEGRNEFYYNNVQLYNYIDILVYVVSKVGDYNLKIQLLSLITKRRLKNL